MASDSTTAVGGGDFREVERRVRRLFEEGEDLLLEASFPLVGTEGSFLLQEEEVATIFLLGRGCGALPLLLEGRRVFTASSSPLTSGFFTAMGKVGLSLSIKTIYICEVEIIRRGHYLPSLEETFIFV